MDNSIQALIVVSPGPLRDGLLELLTAIPQVEKVDEVDDFSEALGTFREPPPTLILIDAALLGGEVWDSLAQIKAQWPKTSSILLVDYAQQQQLAQDAGADGVLLKGCPASKLSATVKSLLP